MKTRISFVSNSSSSSFIVVFPRKPTCIDEVHDTMFNGRDGIVKSQYYDYTYTNKEVAERVFKDTKLKRKATKKDLTEEFETVVWCKMYDIERDIRRGKDPNEISLNLISDNLNQMDQIDTIIDCIQGEINEDKNLRMEENLLQKKYGITDFWDEDKDSDCQKEHSKILKENWNRCLKFEKPKDKAIGEIVKKMVDKFIDEHKDWWYTILIYADEDNDGLLEHGDIFCHVEHIEISHH